MEAIHGFARKVPKSAGHTMNISAVETPAAVNAIYDSYVSHFCRLDKDANEAIAAWRWALRQLVASYCFVHVSVADTSYHDYLIESFFWHPLGKERQAENEQEVMAALGAEKEKRLKKRKHELEVEYQEEEKLLIAVHQEKMQKRGRELQIALSMPR